MILTFRINDENIPALDAAAHAEGIKRSGWINRLIERELKLAGAPPSPSRELHDASKKRLHLRINSDDCDAVDRAAASMGMRRNEWIAKRIRGGISCAAEAVRPSNKTHYEIAQTIAQIVRIGRNVNQAARAVNAAVVGNDGVDLVRCADQLMEMRDDLRQVIDLAEDRLLALALGEQKYWRDDHA